MKVAIIFAVLLGVILQEAMGYDTCAKKCKKYKKTNCRTYYYYSYYRGYVPYTYCSRWTSYIGTCYETCTHGKWGDWSEYDLYNECPVMCGGSQGLAVRTRSCNNPAPWNGGKECEGEDTEEAMIDCNTHVCGDKCPEGEIKYHKHPEVHHMFYQCDHGHKKAFLKNCTQGTVFSADHNTCVLASAHEGDCEEGSMVAHPDECGKFLHCVHGVFYERPCPGGLHFNVQTKGCDWPSTAQCTI